MIRAVTTFGYVGLIRPAPGTWGSLVAMVLAVLAYETALPHWGDLQAAGLGFVLPAGFIAATALVTLLGFWAVPKAIAASDDKDPSEIVIDEVAGQWLAVCFTVIPLWNHGVSILAAWPGYVTPFLLFRLFDIWKPWLVGRADRRGDGAGVMLDDLWAGLFAGLGSVVFAGLYHAVIEPMLGG